MIWKFVYDYRGEGQEQIGILNAIAGWFGADPQVWISMPFWNNFFLMVILIWIQTGFATVILGAALRGGSMDTDNGRVIRLPVEVTITDNGPGIAAPDQLAVFEKFRQVGDPVAGKPQGSGLGLHICKRIVERLIGRIWVENGNAGETCVSFTLPLAN